MARSLYGVYAWHKLETLPVGSFKHPKACKKSGSLKPKRRLDSPSGQLQKTCITDRPVITTEPFSNSTHQNFGAVLNTNQEVWHLYSEWCLKLLECQVLVLVSHRAEVKESF